MKILGIETSCDETAVSIIESSKVEYSEREEKNHGSAHYQILAHALISQTKIHEKYGGVFPMLAKREHAKNLTPLLEQALQQANMLTERHTDLDKKPDAELSTLLNREPALLEALGMFLKKYEKPDIDAIAVTVGPGLEPALWVGINCAKALSAVWNIPIIPINHIEGHVLASLLKKSTTNPITLESVTFPALALIISGGHTELILIKNWHEYDIIGQSRDDAVGEAFDKVARILDLPYPGGPHISRLAETARRELLETKVGAEIKTQTWNIKLPRPMLHSNDYDFSFSGLKTAVLYTVQKLKEAQPEVSPRTTPHSTTQDTPSPIAPYAPAIALEFENAVTEVLMKKTEKAIIDHTIKTLILGGGVIANTHIRQAAIALGATHSIPVYLPSPDLATDNAIMIALAGAIRSGTNDHISGKTAPDSTSTLKARGNLKITAI